MNKRLLKLIRQGDTHSFYRSRAWKKIRKEALVRDNFECMNCKALGKVTKATTVHHIEHLKDNPDKALDLSNLMSLCETCHNLEHPEKLESMRKEPRDIFFETQVEKW